MAPKSENEVTGVLFETDAETLDGGLAKDVTLCKKADDDVEFKIVWRNVAWMIFLHVSAVYGCYLAIVSAKWATVGFAMVLYFMAGMGITAGVHRLWAHRAFKANLPLRIILMLFNTIAHQDCAMHWARDHRVHHKYSETDADPHNSKRGFFFSHVGWLMVRKHPEVINKGKAIDISDLEADGVLQFQKK
jgi:stearoyl-CoA desaturase (delta-9 desaturase)